MQPTLASPLPNRRGEGALSARGAWHCGDTTPAGSHGALPALYALMGVLPDPQTPGLPTAALNASTGLRAVPTAAGAARRRGDAWGTREAAVGPRRGGSERPAPARCSHRPGARDRSALETAVRLVNLYWQLRNARWPARVAEARRDVGAERRRLLRYGVPSTVIDRAAKCLSDARCARCADPRRPCAIALLRSWEPFVTNQQRDERARHRELKQQLTDPRERQPALARQPCAPDEHPNPELDVQQRERQQRGNRARSADLLK